MSASRSNQSNQQRPKLRVRCIGNTHQDNSIANMLIVKQALRDYDMARYQRTTRLEDTRELHVVDMLTLEPPPSIFDINVFVDCMIPMFFDFARTNVLLVDPYWYSPHWDEMLAHIDVVLVKTHAAHTEFTRRVAGAGSSAKVVYIGWRGEDAYRPSKTAAAIAGSAQAWLYEIPATPYSAGAAKAVIAAWKPHYPHLHIVGHPKLVAQIMHTDTSVSGEIVERNNIHPHELNPTRDLEKETQELSELRNTCRVHIVATEGTGCAGAAMVALSTGARCLYFDDSAGITQTLAEVFSAHPAYHVAMPTTIEPGPGDMCLGQRHALCEADWDTAVAKLSSPDTTARKAIRMAYVEAVKKFRSELFLTAWQTVETCHAAKNGTGCVHLATCDDVSKESLPPISIVTLAYNRKQMFKLAVYNYLTMDYPRDKVQWIIVDDSSVDECVQSLLPCKKGAPGIIDPAITYIRLESKIGIGEKRNIGVRAAKHDVIVHMDDDDYYPNTSVQMRVVWMVRAMRSDPTVGCVVCTTLPMYDLCRHTSAINVPPLWLSLAQRCSEATMVYTRKFWEERNYTTDMAEGEEFLKGRLARVREIPTGGVIVSLLHSKNAGGRGDALAGTEPNGSHFQFSDQLYTFLHSLDPKSSAAGPSTETLIKAAAAASADTRQSESVGAFALPTLVGGGEHYGTSNKAIASATADC